MAGQLFSESGDKGEAGEGSNDGTDNEAGNTDQGASRIFGRRPGPGEDSGQEGAGQEKDSGQDGAGQEGDSGQKGSDQGSGSGQEGREVSGRSQVYLEDEKMYLVTLENGFTFRSSVPEGMLINQSVAIYPGEGQYTSLQRGGGNSPERAAGGGGIRNIPSGIRGI
ncbi:MAG: hypothetical protein ACLTW9_23485 [Enterocloster sp.]